MTAIVPSFSAKITRAKKHLVDLETEISGWISTKPYAVSESIEGKKKKQVRRLVFTSDPANTDIPIIAADAVYCLRSSLDHLMSALVANKDRGSAMFPIYFQGVWEAIVPGENQERIKQRLRWASDIKTVRTDAVAILKALQPPDNAGDNDEANLLRFINNLSNRDRHTKLPVIATGLSGMMVRWRLPDGKSQAGIGTPNEAGGFFKDQARITQIPENAMNVEIAGTPLIAISVGKDKRNVERHLEIPKELHTAAALIEREVIPRLAPFVQ